ncbi:MAG: phosphoribosylaminoimidazolesuccinocarboxamide synthase [Elusimicrobia bacterium]|nr:phosphoribosylaminoimidazolesuccinocarboxamide synthase [Elusimicrobiota bacterium]
MNNLSELKVYKGKVRDVYFAGEDKLIICATDRISAFDFVLPNEIPNKGKILNKISLFWFEKTKHIIKNHLISSDFEEMKNLTGTDLPEDFAERSVLAAKAKRIDFECIVRGYITGSGWKEYLKKGSVCGVKLPPGLKEAQKLPRPIFTPTTKADKGHDENVSFEFMADKIGIELAEKIKEKSLRLYEFAREYLLKKGIILADTKLEFGILDGELILIDEAFTPDSSRFWDAATYSLGKSPDSFDKQFVRNWLIKSGWDLKTPPVPQLPKEIILKTAELYKKIEEIIIK